MRCLVSLILLWGFLISQSLFAIRPSEPSSGLLSKVVREGMNEAPATGTELTYSALRISSALFLRQDSPIGG